MKKSFTSLSAGLAALLFVQSASAYNWKTHSRIVEVAVEAMQQGSLFWPDPNSAPAGVDPVAWHTYLGDILAAQAKLALLNTGVGNPGREDPQKCGYSPLDNMAQLPFMRIKDMNYLQVRGSVRPAVGKDPAELGISCTQKTVYGPAPGNPHASVPRQIIDCTAENTDCSVKPKDTANCPNETAADFDSVKLGRVLGWQAASVDDHIEDVQLWVRPTSSLLVNVLADIALDPIGTALLVIGGAIVVGIECFIDLFTGGSCSGQAEKALNMLNDVSPVKAIAGSWVPGIDLDRSDDYTGMWHFIDCANFDGKTNQYNPHRGLLYEEAGPNGSPGAVDLLISLAAGDIAGVSLDADSSAGVSKYAPFDQKGRSRSDWVSPTIGHVEFSAISSLADYGYAAFKQFPTSAVNLGYPLHAIGDAAEPQHVAGTTAWGHRPFEDETDNLLDGTVLPPPPSCTLRFAGAEDIAPPPITSPQMNDILLNGFNFLNSHRSDTQPGSLVDDLAQHTFAFAHAAPGETVYHDYASSEYLFSSDPHTRADEEYADSTSQMMTMLDLGVGATIAFLTMASKDARDAGPNNDAVCPANSPYTRFETPDAFGDKWDCIVGMGEPPASASTTTALCIGNGSCGTPLDAGTSGCGVLQPCNVQQDCPATFTCNAGCCYAQVR
jgi:hypothetical protein